MPLRLKSLELHGYKTFASRTLFEFADGITSIVGPNGSGKSNFADSLRWVLGEQSHNLLRAKKTEDMIFAGSEHRARSGMASVTITFDNSANWLPVDFSEVALTRRAYRDGRNEYQINGQTVRLKDINELLAQSGLSERTYTILGQGMVDASLALKADERRRLFEEAAGIGLYRSRREESLRRLDTTQRNLERVLDILAELEPRLKLLEKQARRAQEYAQIQSDLRAILREWYGYHWHQAQKELSEVRLVAVQNETKLLEARAQYNQLNRGFEDIRSKLLELRTQLNGWHRQSAELHNQREVISRDLAVLEERRRAMAEARQSATLERDSLSDEVRLAEERLREAIQEHERIVAEAEDARAQETDARAALQGRQLERAKAEQLIQTARQTLNGLNTRRAQQEARLASFKERLDALRIRHSEIDQSIQVAEQALQMAEKELKQKQKESETARLNHQKNEENLIKLKEKLDSLDSSRRNRQDELNTGLTEKSRLQAQLEVLQQAEESLSGFAEGARYLLDAARQSQLGGTVGALSSKLEVPAEYEVALAASLGDAVDAVLLNSNQDVDHALALLESSQAGRAFLLPLESESTNKLDSVTKTEECFGLAADLIKVTDEINQAVRLILGNTIVVRDRLAARRLRKSYPTSRLVTLKGEVFRPDGGIQAGKDARGASLGRTRQKRELSEQLRALLTKLETLEKTVSSLNKEYVSLQESILTAETKLKETQNQLTEKLAEEQKVSLAVESNRRQLDWQVSQKANLKGEINQLDKEREQVEINLDESQTEIEKAQESVKSINLQLAELALDDLQAQVSYWSARLQVSERTVQDAAARRIEREQNLKQVVLRGESATQRIESLDVTVESLEAEKNKLHQQERELHSQLDELRLKIEPAEKSLVEAEAREFSLQEKETEAQKALAQVERYNAQSQIEFNRRTESLDTLRRRIEEDFGLVQFEYQTDISGPVPLPFEGMVEQLPVVETLALDLEDSLIQKRSQLRRMGAVNLEAQQEFESVQERYGFLTSQVTDLRQAEVDLRQVIAELDELTRREFFKTFEAVAVEFKEIFTRLFGGGSARLILTDPDNLTETGIDIEAKLPGRREQSLGLLSGGERSLTAISLVFALLKISPTPVCVMDEVDAMLDEANVGRFRDLLRELGEHTQFVVVTHNRNTVQAADIIYGVTMGRDSASQIISLKLDEVSDEMLGNRG